MTKGQYLKTNQKEKIPPHENFAQKKVLIFASGNGSNFEAIVKYFNSNDFGAGLNIKPNTLKAVKFELITDKKDAPVIQKAKALGIPYFYVKFENLYDFLKPKKDEYDLYVLAGYMRILPEKILNLGITYNLSRKKQNKIINIHPSLLPEFKGKNAILRAFEAKKEKTGVTIHFVEKNVDLGKIIAQKSHSIIEKSFEELENAIHKIEHKLYPKTIENLLFKKNILLFGGGAREHALAEKLSNSPFLDTLYLVNPNDGFKHLGKTIDFTASNNTVEDFKNLAKQACSLNINLLIVGPENPLFESITDIFQNEGISVIGANQKWAELEGSKSFAKSFMTRNGIKTADYKILENKKEIIGALEYFKEKYQTPPVIKADGPALGKGVSLPENFEAAKLEAINFLDGKFGKSSKKILFEERLSGKEISVISLWDGKTLVSFPPASDYKRLLEDNKGPNTGGMGAIAPSKIGTKEKEELKKYLEALKIALTKENANFKGIIYSGLILTKKGIYVLEYNMRFGDPETQVLFELLETDLLDIFIKMAAQKLDEINLKFNKKKAHCVVLASKGYPENPKKGALIENLEIVKKNKCKIYFAGVKMAKNIFNPKSPNAENALFTNGGRVLNIVRSGRNSKKIFADIYKTAQGIIFEGKIYRKDIGNNKQNA